MQAIRVNHFQTVSQKSPFYRHLEIIYHYIYIIYILRLCLKEFSRDTPIAGYWKANIRTTTRALSLLAEYHFRWSVRTSEATLRLFENPKTLRSFIVSSLRLWWTIESSSSPSSSLSSSAGTSPLESVSRDDVKESLTVDREDALVEDETVLKEVMLREWWSGCNRERETRQRAILNGVSAASGHDLLTCPA